MDDWLHGCLGRGVGWGGWIRTIIMGFKVPCPALRRRPTMLRPSAPARHMLRPAAFGLRPSQAKPAPPPGHARCMGSGARVKRGTGAGHLTDAVRFRTGPRWA